MNIDSCYLFYGSASASAGRGPFCKILGFTPLPIVIAKMPFVYQIYWISGEHISRLICSKLQTGRLTG